MADGIGQADTSSYAKAPLPVSMLDTVGKLNALDQQKLNINQSKLDQANQGLTYLTRAMTSLGPNATKDQYKEIGAQMVQSGLVPENMLHIWNDRVDAAPDSPTFFKQTLAATADHQMQLKLGTGTDTNQSDNSTTYQGKTDPLTGGFTPATQAPLQVPPTQPNVNNQPTLPNGQPNPAYMQPGIVGSGSPGFTPAGRGLPVQGAAPTPVAAAPIASPRMPVQQPSIGSPAASGLPGTVNAIPVDRTKVAGNSPIVTGPPPNFDVGQKMFQQDQLSATGKATSLKPLEEAYDLAKSVATGPGTETLNKARAYLANAGLIKADEKNPTVIYQMLNKNLAQFIDKTGSRSDADLAVKESGNANAKTQLQPALMHMVQKIIGRERIEMARPQAFEGSDYQNYGKHSASFPTSQDERAYSIDKMPAAEARQLYSNMRAKALAGNPEGIKFLKSLSTAKKTGVISGLGQ